MKSDLEVDGFVALLVCTEGVIVAGKDSIHNDAGQCADSYPRVEEMSDENSVLSSNTGMTAFSFSDFFLKTS